MDNRNPLEFKIDSVQRSFMCHALARVLPLYIVTEYPKSGGSWAAQMLAEYMNLPFPRNRRPRFESCIMHGHYPYSPLLKNAVCVMRDGRDITVSAYFHFLFENERSSPYVVNRIRQQVPFRDYENVNQNLPAFIEYLFGRFARHEFHFTWAEFSLGWLAGGGAIVRYEDLLVDSAAALRQIVKVVANIEPDTERIKAIVSRYSFETLSGRHAGIERSDSFLRKGISGDWKNKYTREACEVFDHYAGDALIELGYEKDHSWVSQTVASI